MSVADDPLAEGLIAFLEREGADQLRHGRGRSLLDHLVETYTILRRWQQPREIQHAGLIHSVYGTDAFDQQLLPLSRRDDVREIAGEQAERLAYLFCVTPRGPIMAGTHRWTRIQADATRDELDVLVLLHLANLAEQAQATDGSPGRWLISARELAALLDGSDVVAPPPFTARLAAFTDADESLTRHAYLSGQFELAAAACPVVPEPCIRLAESARSSGDEPAARSWTDIARNRLHDLGTAWDKRLTFEELERLTENQARPAVRKEDGRDRFHRYLETLTDDARGRIYPDLESQPWHDPQQFPLAGYLEAHADEIRGEVEALDPWRFTARQSGSTEPATGMWPSSTSAGAGGMRSATNAR